VYLEISGGEDDADDALFEDISNVLDMVESGLSNRDFTFPLRTSNALLGVRVIAKDVDADAARAALEGAVADLRAEVEERPNRHPNVRVALSCAVGEALCRASTTGVEVVGGPLLEVATWTEQGMLAS
jgi:hypothetical protein